MSDHHEKLPPNYHRNFAALVGDFVGFGTALTFVSPDSVLPAFVGQLVNSAPLIGLTSTIFGSGWLLPQLAVGRWINDKPRKKPYMLAGTAGRVAFLIIALALWSGLARHPLPALLLAFACFALFTTTDSLAGVAWFDIMARAIPSRLRGRMIGTGQTISGILGIGIGALVGLILGRYTFPENFALLFVLGSVCLAVSTVALFLIREPPLDKAPAPPSPARGGWLKPLLADPTLRRLMLCRILVGMMGMATPFYVTHATEALGLSKSAIGSFVIAQTIAGVLASITLGMVQGRRGSQSVIRIGSAAAVLGPLLALATNLIHSPWIVPLYPLVFVSLGVMNSTWILGFFNYVLDIAPEESRSTYIGAANTLVWPLTLMSIVGGGLLEVTGRSYAILFGATAILVGAGFLSSLSLKPSRPARLAPAKPVEEGV